jgi:Predicted membrane protein
LQVFDPATRLGQWISEPEQARKLAGLARGWTLQALDLLDEAAVRRAIQGFVVEQLRNWNAAGTAGELLTGLTADNRHQRVLDEGLRRIADWLDDESIKQRASALIVRYIRKEWPTLASTVDWVKPIDEIGDSLAERLASAALEELQQVLSEPEHPLRQDYARWVGQYIERLRHDPELAVQVDAIKQRMIDTRPCRTTSPACGDASTTRCARTWNDPSPPWPGTWNAALYRWARPWVAMPRCATRSTSTCSAAPND